MTGRKGLLECMAIHPSKHKNFATVGALRDHGNKSIVAESDLVHELLVREYFTHEAA